MDEIKIPKPYYIIKPEHRFSFASLDPEERKRRASEAAKARWQQHEGQSVVEQAYRAAFDDIWANPLPGWRIWGIPTINEELKQLAMTRGQDFSQPGPRIYKLSQSERRNLTKFFEQRAVWSHRDLLQEAMYWQTHDVPHWYRRRPDWYRQEWIDVCKRVDRQRTIKLICWGAYIKPGRLKFRLVVPTPEWPFHLQIVRWADWQKHLWDR